VRQDIERVQGRLGQRVGALHGHVRVNEGGGFKELAREPHGGSAAPRQRGDHRRPQVAQRRPRLRRGAQRHEHPGIDEHGDAGGREGGRGPLGSSGGVDQDQRLDVPGADEVHIRHARRGDGVAPRRRGFTHHGHAHGAFHGY